MFDTVSTAAARHDGAFRGKRIAWERLWAMRPDLRPASTNVPQAKNDNVPQGGDVGILRYIPTERLLEARA